MIEIGVGKCPYCGNDIVETRAFISTMISGKPNYMGESVWKCSKCPIFKASRAFLSEPFCVIQKNNETEDQAYQRFKAMVKEKKKYLNVVGYKAPKNPELKEVD